MPPTARKTRTAPRKTAKTAKADAAPTAFHSEDVGSTGQRPTGEITIGSNTFTARAPKMPLWMDSGFLYQRIDDAERAQERLNKDVILIAAERRRLEQQIQAAPSAQEIHQTLIDGYEDDARMRGGFLRVALGPEQYRQLVAELDDPDSDLDLPDVYEAALTLYHEFEPWFIGRAKVMGVAAPNAKRKR